MYSPLCDLGDGDIVTATGLWHVVHVLPRRTSSSVYPRPNHATLPSVKVALLPPGW